MMFLLILVLICFILIDIPDLIEKKYRRELMVYFAFLSFGFLISIFLAIGIPIPNPVRAIEYVVKDLLHLNYK